MGSEMIISMKKDITTAISKNTEIVMKGVI